MLDFFYMLKRGIANKNNSDEAIEWVFCHVMRDYKHNPKVLGEACALIDRHRKSLARKMIGKAVEFWEKEEYPREEYPPELLPRRNWMGAEVTNPIHVE